MARPHPDRIVIDDLRGGRNDTDPPMSLPPTQCVEALNIDWKDTTFGRKRGGAAAVTETGGTAFSSGMQSLFRHVPGGDETAAELWGIDGAATPVVKRMAGATTFANVTMMNNIASRPQDVVAVSFNGKLFLAFDSTVDVLHVYDPNLGTPQARKVNFTTPAAPTAANTGSGSYAATLRYYRVRWIQTATIGGASTLVRRSEPSASIGFTPSGSGSASRVTQPTPPSEGETHWEVEVSTDNATWFQRRAFPDAFPDGSGATPLAIGTTTFDDAQTVAGYVTNNASDPAGMHSRFPSVKYLLTDGNRLLGAGAWESTGGDSLGKNSRVWFTPVLGSADKGDDERVPNQTNQKNWVDLNENDGGGITGLGGPFYGVIIVFKYRQVWRLTPTGDVVTPYLPKKLRDDIGCIHHKTISLGEDEQGQPALYFLSHRGPYRITVDRGIQFLGRDNQVTWRSVNLAATTVVAHATYYPDLQQWWVWIATGSANDPDVKMMFDVQLGFPDQNGQVRGGWAKHTGNSAGARCSCLMSNTLGATMSRDLKPYIGRSSGTAIWKCDTTDLDDAGTDFQAYVDSRPVLTTGQLGRKIGMFEPYLLATALSGVSLTLTTQRGFGLESRTHTVALTAAASETRVFKKIEGGEVGEADVLQVRLGDGAAQEGAWSVDALVIPTQTQEWA